MAVAETNKIITHGDGQSIAEAVTKVANSINDQAKNVHLSDDQTISGSKTFSSPVKTDEVDTKDGSKALVRNSSGKSVYGNASQPSVIMGSGDRPTYSKSGSDLTGTELALNSDVTTLKSSVDTQWDTLMSILGVGRWANQSMYNISSEGVIVDPLLPYYTAADRMFANGAFRWHDSESPSMNITVDFKGMEATCKFMFQNYANTGTLTLKNLTITAGIHFLWNSNFTEIHAENVVAKGGIWNDAYEFFGSCDNLKVVEGFDLSNFSRFTRGFVYSPNIEKVYNMKYAPWSAGDGGLDFSGCPKITRENAIVILNELPTSTINSPIKFNSASALTDEDMAIGTAKGWVVSMVD